MRYYRYKRYCLRANKLLKCPVTVVTHLDVLWCLEAGLPWSPKERFCRRINREKLHLNVDRQHLYCVEHGDLKNAVLPTDRLWTFCLSDQFWDIITVEISIPLNLIKINLNYECKSFNDYTTPHFYDWMDEFLHRYNSQNGLRMNIDRYSSWPGIAHRLFCRYPDNTQAKPLKEWMLF